MITTTEENTFTVNFYDYDNTLLNTQTVVYGGSAVPPQTPEREGYYFLAWSGNTDYITQDTSVTAIYRKNRKDSVIEVYRGTVKTGEIKAVLDCSLIQKLNGECSLSLSTFNSKLGYLTADSQLEISDLIFNIRSIKKETRAAAYFITVEAEHVSYLLNNDEYKIAEFSFTGSPKDCLNRLLADTPFTAGEVDFSGEITLLINKETTRRNALMQLVATVGGEISYSNYCINIKSHIGKESAVDLLKTGTVTDLGFSYNLADNTEDYEVSLYKDKSLALGDEVLIKFSPLGLNQVKRVIEIERNPFNIAEIKITLGTYEAELSDLYEATNEELAEDQEALKEEVRNYITRLAGLEEKVDKKEEEENNQLKIVSVSALPAQPEENTVYLIQGEVIVE